MIIVLTKEQIKEVASMSCDYCGAEPGEKCRPKQQYVSAAHVDRYPWNDSHKARSVAAGIRPDAPYYSRPRSKASHINTEHDEC